MWIWLVGVSISVIVIGVVIWLFFVANKKSQALLRSMPLYYRCMHCGLPFIPRSKHSYLPTCTKCGQTTNISGQKPFSQNDIDRANRIKSADTSQPETWIEFAAEQIKLGRYADAIECLEMIGKLSNIDEKIKRTAAEMIESIKSISG